MMDDTKEICQKLWGGEWFFSLASRSGHSFLNPLHGDDFGIKV
jgi:hypothetical protein